MFRMKFSYPISGFLTLFILAIYLTACSDDNEEENLPPDATGSIRVTVIFNDSIPAENIKVAIDSDSLQTVTDSDGVALFDGLKVGDYLVKIEVKDAIGSLEKPAAVTEGNTAEVIFNVSVARPLIDTSENLEGVKILLQHAYDLLKEPLLFDATGYISYWGDIGADVAIVQGNVGQDYYELDRYEIQSSNNLVYNVWTAHYRLISTINTALEVADKLESSDNQGKELQIAIAELRFLRGLILFNLVKIYGNPVLVISSSFDISNPPQITQDPERIYSQIIEDLQFSENNLSQTASNEKASRKSAAGLLGKVYLQMAGFPMLQEDRYDMALEQFAKLEGQYSLETDYADVFDPSGESVSSEILFNIDFDSTMDNEGGNYGIFWAPIGFSQFDALALAPGFAENYFDGPDALSNPVSFPLETSDGRFYHNIATFKDENGSIVNSGDISEWRPLKYINDGSSEQPGSSPLDFPYLRYADVLLMVAEAENAMNGPTQKAYDALNTVRRRAFGSDNGDVRDGLDQQEFLNVILAERRRELCFEGQRKDDLVRTGRLQQVIDEFNANTSGPLKDYQPHEYVWPIPQQEMDINPDLVQNPGY